MIAFLLLVVASLVQIGSASLDHQESPTLHRNKRELIDLVCPRSAAIGDDLGQNSFIIFISPTTQEDVIVAYEDNKWTDESIQTLIDNGFNSSRPTVLYSHGFHQTGTQPWLKDARRIYGEILANNTEPLYNMFIFDWSNYSNLHYWTSVSYVPHLGRILGEFLEKLGKSQSYDMNKMHVIGYSLSTHIVGLASRNVQNNYATIGQMTALDPTGVCMHSESKFAQENALRPSDAKFVVARHYNMEEYGARRPIGDLDIFVNGGKEQPMPVTAAPSTNQRILDRLRSRVIRDVSGEEFEVIEEDSEEEFDDSNMVVRGRQDHRRATAHETQTIDQQCHDMAYECESYEAYLRGECADCGQDGSKCYFVSNYKNILAEARGEQLRAANYIPGTKMFIKTDSQDSYCMHHYQLLAQLNADASDATKTLLSNGVVEFNIQNSQTVQLQGPSSGLNFTALVSVQSKIEHLSAITMKVNAVTSATREFLNSLDHMELNYMSHYSPEERAEASIRLCLNQAKTSLIRC